MQLFNNKPKIKFLKCLDVSHILNCSDARLIHIKGLGKLKECTHTVSDDYYGATTHVQITLNDLPLLYAHSPGCPTCASLIATGYGIENCNCKELQAISNKINSSFVNLENAIDDLEPLLLLLETGLYVIADMLCYPTDGNKNFFWNTPNDYTENPASGMVWLNDADFDSEFVDGQPFYLFPTQGNNRLNEERVKEYIKIFNTNSQHPRAIAYHYDQFLSFLIDGHHKACAANLMCEPVNTIVIIPLTSCYCHYINSKPEKTEYKFANFIIPEHEIPHEYRTKKKYKKSLFNNMDEKHTVNSKIWDNNYLNNAKYFPSIMDIAMVKASDVNEVNNQLIEEWLQSDSPANKTKLRSLLALWKVEDNIKLKKLALKCAQLEEYSLLKKEAFRALCNLKNDPEIEDFFINYLVEDEDRHSLLKIIADSYWDD